MSDTRTYYGVMIHRETTPNAYGLRWWAIADSGLRLRSDTLDGMRELIRDHRDAAAGRCPW